MSLADLVCTVHLNIIQSLQTIDVTAGVLLLVRVSTTNQWELVRFGKDQETDRRAQLALMILPFIDLLSQVKNKTKNKKHAPQSMLYLVDTGDFQKGPRVLKL